MRDPYIMVKMWMMSAKAETGREMLATILLLLATLNTPILCIVMEKVLLER